MVKSWIFYVATLIVVFTSACSTTNSDNVSTGGIYAALSISENGAVAQASATFYVGGITGTVLQLSAGDSVACNGNVLSEQQNLFGGYSYVGNCGTLTAGAMYSFVFTRDSASGNDEVYTSTVTLPEAVNITAPADASTFTRGNPINVTWTASTDSVLVTLSGQGTSSDPGGGSTSFSSTNSASDNGAYTIIGTDTDPDSITGAISNAYITVRRSRSGTMDASLDGSISASRSDSVINLTINP